MAIRIYNTLSSQKEDFVPREANLVTMYVCGVTVYDSSHIGHAMSALSFDVIRRYLEYRGYEVRHIINFTDIDDKIIRRAQTEGIDWQVITERYIAEYLEAMDALNVKQATFYPRATLEIDNIKKAVEELIGKGFAYEVNGDVYYRVLKKPEYGELKHQNVDELRAGARVETGIVKENDLDFALWKAAKPGEPSWSSPWGEGRPGWHIECSAMALQHLGAQIDIHGGGTDLIFPHHENEIAQSEALTGKRPFVKYWAHNGMLQAKVWDEAESKFVVEKMSKSLGNTLTITNLLTRGDSDMLRIFVLGSHYRNPVTYTDESFEVALRSLDRLKGVFAHDEKWPDALDNEGDSLATTALQKAIETAKIGFETAMDDDFNTPQALARLFDLVRETFKGRDMKASGRVLNAARETLAELGGILGIRMKDVSQATSLKGAEPFIDLLVETRRELKGVKQFGLADRIREQLKELGVKLEDRAEGTSWRFEK